jgi:Tfp pilus assembly protein PilF
MSQDSRTMTAAISTLSLMRLAERHINLGNPRGAIEPLRRVLAENPDHALAHAYLGMCLQQVGEPGAAQTSIRTALGLAPDNGFVSYVAGYVALSQKRLGAAEEWLTRARQRMPEHAETYRLLAIVYGRTKRWARVLPTLQEGLSHDPNNHRVIADFGTHLNLLGRVAEAEMKALEALKICPESPEAHVLMGQVRLRQRRISEAREHALTALLINANYAPALQLLASIELQANFLVGAWWRFAVWLARPRSDKAHLSLAFLIGAALYAPSIVLFAAHRDLLAWAAIAGVALCIGGLWLAKKLFVRAIQNSLREFRLRQSF